MLPSADPISNEASLPFAPGRHAVVLRGLLDASILEVLRSHVEGLVERGHLLEDPQVPGRLVAHNERLFRRFHGYLAAELSRRLSLPEEIMPSYSYLCMYREGVKLRPHFDRPQCAYNLTVPIHQSPAGEAFPLWVRTGDGIKPLLIEPGDGGFFSGTDLEHWRPPLPRGATLTACIYHFVPRSFADNLD